MNVKKLIQKKIMTDKTVSSLKGKFIDESYIKTLINYDCDVFDNYGNILVRFRKNIIPYNIVEKGYESFKLSIEKTEGRGAASGASKKRIRKDGTLSNTTVGNFVTSGNVGYMDKSAMIRYCRMTNFGRNHFKDFNEGIPFVKYIDKLYSNLCPDHYSKQRALADATNINYKIKDTCFTTVTVNKSFRTAVHQDSGDFRDGFGNLIVFNDGSYTGGYFVLPQYGIGVDVQTTDALFVDVHKWHGNTEMKIKKGYDEIFRISFVLYYRENMFKCSAPTKQLKELKQKYHGYLKL
mgnify:CR=1 FL=1|tara:strand:+ start:535 stop:1413 length:879 start_codon:yes stop_codon:yes gene_type:complete